MATPKHQTPRGTRDLLPAELQRWRWAEDRARRVLERYGYGEIRTPAFEDYALFARTSGESSDVVQKEMYRFQDLGERDLALRPEGTAPVARAYLQHGLASQGRIHRLWYMGPMFRYGRPQKGRYRQFWQIGAEIIGTDAPGADVEMIALFVDVFEAWGFQDLTVAVNSVGTPATRQAYGEALRRWLAPAHARLTEDARVRLAANPLRLLDTKDEGDRAVLADPSLGAMPRMLDVLDADSRSHWDRVIEGLTAVGVKWELDHGLVRGLDYYTRTAFEVHDRSLGAQSALGGGGRYDGLIEDLGGPATPAIGFSIGLDRALLVLEERGVGGAAAAGGIYVAAMDATRDAVPALVRALRRAFTVECDVEARALGAQMKAAAKGGARLVVILGEDEWARGAVTVKDLASGAQDVVPREGLATVLRERLAGAAPEAR